MKQFTDTEERFHAIQTILFDEALLGTNTSQRAEILHEAGFDPFEAEAVEEVFQKEGQAGIRPLVEFRRDEVSEEYRRKIGASTLGQIDKPL